MDMAARPKKLKAVVAPPRNQVNTPPIPAFPPEAGGAPQAGPRLY